jgi:RNA polymerase sigma factor (sigma-70 family)
MSIDPILEAEAIADWKAGDLLAGNHLLRMHAGLIYTTVRRYITGRCEIDDLLQVGRWALLRAALDHDAALGRLSTYATRRIRCAALALMRRERSIVRTPLHDRESRVSVASLDLPVGKYETIVDCLPAPEVEEPSGIDLDPLVDALPHVHRDTIRRLYGPSPQTLEEVGAARGVSKEAARVAKERALDRLRVAAGEAALGTHCAKRNAAGAARRGAAGAAALKCSLCDGERHNRRTCPLRKAA